MKLDHLPPEMIPTPWVLKDQEGLPYLELRRGNVWITIEERPTYCDRGNWIAKISKPGAMFIDGADFWPRYYFSLTNAFNEIAAFLDKRRVANPEDPCNSPEK